MNTAIETTKTYKVLGFTENITDCDCCGRTDLKGTLVLQNNENGDVNYFGVVCGSKIAKNTTKNIKDILTETEKQNIEKAKAEFRASKEYAQAELYMEFSNPIMDSLSNFDERMVYVTERMRLGKLANEKKVEIAAKYFIKYTHRF